MQFFLFKVNTFLYEIGSCSKTDIHMVTFSLFSMYCHNVFKYVYAYFCTLFNYDLSCT